MVTSAFALVRAVLAAHRLARLIVEDEITSDLRDLVFSRFPPETNKLGYLLTCMHCTSVWTAFFVVVALRAPTRTHTAATVLVDTLAISGAVSLLSETRAYLDTAVNAASEVNYG